MKSLPVIFLLFAVGVTFIFGAFLMLHSGVQQNHNLCIPGVIDQRECGYGVNSFEYIRLHISALAEFTAAVIPFVSTFVLALLLLFVSATGVFGKNDTLLSGFLALYSAVGLVRQKTSKKFFAWLSVLEKRDPALRPGL